MTFDNRIEALIESIVKKEKTPVGKLRYNDSGWNSGNKFGYVKDEKDETWMQADTARCLEFVEKWNKRVDNH